MCKRAPPTPCFSHGRLQLGIHDLERRAECTLLHPYRRHNAVGLSTLKSRSRSLDAGSSPSENGLESDIHGQLLKSMDYFPGPLCDGKVHGFSYISTIRAGPPSCPLAAIGTVWSNKVVLNAYVGFIDIQLARPKQSVNNLGETSNTFIRIQVSNYLDWKRNQVCQGCAQCGPIPHLIRFEVSWQAKIAVAVKFMFSGSSGEDGESRANAPLLLPSEL